MDENQIAEAGSLPDLSQEVAPPDPTEILKQENEGLKKALQEERVHKAKAEAKAEFLREWSEKQKQEVAQKEEIGVDEDDFITVRDAKKILNKRLEEVVVPEREERRRLAIAQQEADARKNHDDWGDVYSRLIEPKLQTDPDFHRLVYSAQNPPEMAYAWAIAQPEYQKEFKKKVTSENIDKINKNLNMTTTLASAGGGGTSKAVDEVTRIKNMSREEFEAELDRVKGIGRGA